MVNGQWVVRRRNSVNDRKTGVEKEVERGKRLVGRLCAPASLRLNCVQEREVLHASLYSPSFPFLHVNRKQVIKGMLT